MSYLQGCKKMGMTCTVSRDMPQEDILILPTAFGDIGDAAPVKNVVKEQPEIVAHLAALTLVAYSYEHPVEVLEPT